MKEAHLSAVSQINPPKTKGLEPDLFCSFVPMEAVDEDSGSITEPLIRKVSEVERGYTPFINGDVIFAKITPCMENGKCAIAWDLKNDIGFGSTEFHVIRAGPDVIPEWIYYFLRQENVRQQGVQWFHGTAGQQRVPKDFLEQLKLPIPSLSEQRRIAAILAKADRLRRLRRTARQLGETFLQSVFVEMFGEPGKNIKKWNIGKVGSHITSIRYGTGSPPEYQEKGIPFIRATNVKQGTIRDEGLVFISSEDATQISKCKVKAGDLIVVRSGVNAGDCALVPYTYDGAYAAFDLIIEAPFPTNYFINFLINSPFGRAIISTLSRRAGQPHVNAEQIAAIEFPFPPIVDQHRFAQGVMKYNKLLGQQREAERQAEMLFQALLRRVFLDYE